MRALSIRQPWAWLIASGIKDIENRTWATNYRGPVLIHASKTRDEEEFTEARKVLWRGRYHPDNLPVPMPPPFRAYGRLEDFASGSGGIIGVADLVDVVTESSSPWFFGPYGFVLNNARQTPLVPCKGRLGFFRVGDDVRRAVEECLEAQAQLKGGKDGY